MGRRETFVELLGAACYDFGLYLRDWSRVDLRQGFLWWLKDADNPRRLLDCPIALRG